MSNNIKENGTGQSAGERKLIGELGVNSGMALLCDPCYIENGAWVDSSEYSDSEFSYDGCGSVTDYSRNKCLGGQLNIKSSETSSGHSAVAFSGGYGDGSYPVYATYNEDGRIAKVDVIFDSDDEALVPASTKAVKAYFEIVKGQNGPIAGERKLIGELGVNSGMALLCDPCYIKKGTWGDGSEFSYDGCCSVTDYSRNSCGGGQLNFERKFNETYSGPCAVAFSTGYSDGAYPVYATYNEDGRIAKVEVIFDSDNE